MKLNIEVDETLMAPALIENAENQIWHINDTIKRIIENGSYELHNIEDLRDFFHTLDACNHMIKYYGGTPVEVQKVDAKIGYDIRGNKFE